MCHIRYGILYIMLIIQEISGNISVVKINLKNQAISSVVFLESFVICCKWVFLLFIYSITQFVHQ